jgi:hypothetical protein
VRNTRPQQLPEFVLIQILFVLIKLQKVLNRPLVALYHTIDGTPSMIVFQAANDPTETAEGVSRTPGLMVIKNMDSGLQYMPGAVFELFDLPDGWKNLQIVLRYVLKDWCGPDGIGKAGTGVRVPACSRFSYDRHVRVDIAVVGNDTMATPMANRQMVQPARVGACTFSVEVTGMNSKQGMVYLHAIRRTKNARIKREFTEAFANAPSEVRDLVRQPPPVANTHRLVMELCRKAEADKRPLSNKHHISRVGVSCYAVRSSCVLHVAPQRTTGTGF